MAKANSSDVETITVTVTRISTTDADWQNTTIDVTSPSTTVSAPPH
jgi:hypothetical protein